MLVACQDDPEPKGQLIIALDTDMALPDAIDQVDISVDVNGVRRFSNPYSLGAGMNSFTVPATLTLLAGDDPAASVRVRVVGRKGERYRTFREIITTVPERRTATMRMPLQWLCDDSADVKPTTDDEGFTVRQPVSKCDDGFTCRAGTCQPNEEKAADLPDYTPASVFGGAALPEDGTCFDTIACMIKGTVASLDDDCSIARPTESDSVNVALRVSSDGICDSTKTVCFVPLDRDPKEGWSDSDDGERIQLPKAVCSKLDDGSISHVYVSTECVTKLPGMPPCGAWTSATKSNAPSADTEPAPQPKLAATLPDTHKPCCPLLSDGDKLYTCACASKSSASVFELDPGARTAHSIAALNPSATRQSDSFGAAVHDDVLYWAADDLVQLTPLTSERLANSLDVKGAVFETASVLVDDAAVYVLASGVDDAEGAPVKVIKLAPDGARRVFETGGTHALFQLDQDASAVYAISSADEKQASGMTERKSTIVRLDKQTGASVQVLAPASLTLEASQLDQGGYTGVRIDASAHALYALFESTRTANGNIKVEIRKADTGNVGSEPESLWDLTFDPARTQLRLQGIVDGALIFSRSDYDADGKLASSALLSLSDGASQPRALQKLPRDYPMAGLGSDAQSIYWLTASGQLFGFPRSELR